MKRQKIVIFGNRQIAEVAHFYLTQDSPFEVVAFTVDAAYLEANQFQGLPVIPFEQVETKFPPSEYGMFVAVSYQQVNQLRVEKYEQASQKGYRLISYVSSRAITWPGLVVGANCFILEANVIQPFVEIGNNVTLWSGNHIGHHSVIEDHCFIASHVVVSGNCLIGTRTFVGVNATLRDGITVAADCVIGAGALIMKNTRPYGVYPAQPTSPVSIRSDQLKRL